MKQGRSIAIIWQRAQLSATDYETDDELNEMYRFYLDDAGFLTKDEIVRLEGSSEKIVEWRNYLYDENNKLKQMKQTNLYYDGKEYTEDTYETIADFEWIHDDMVEGISGMSSGGQMIDGEWVGWSEFSMYYLEYRDNSKGSAKLRWYDRHYGPYAQ